MKAIRRSVCLLTNTYPDNADSTRAVFIRDLARLLDQNEWKVSVVAPRVFAESQPYEKDGGVQVNRFPSFLGGKLLIEHVRTPVVRLVGYMVSGIVSAAAAVRRDQSGLIHAHWIIPAGLIALVVGKLLRKPVVVTAHGSDILVVPKRSALLRRLVKLVLQKADAVTSVAEHVTAEIRNLGIGRDDILTFPMSVPAGSFTPDGPRVEEWEDRPVIFSNRSLYPLYNVQLLVKAAPLIRERVAGARICIAGKGPELNALSSLAQSLGASKDVQFLGEVPHERMPQYLRSAAAYVSTALSDGASVSLLEAMACGAVPVVADIPANREWVKDGENGFLFAPEDVRALAVKIEECIVRTDVRRKASRINIDIAGKKAQWNSNVNKLLNLYEKIMAQR